MFLPRRIRIRPRPPRKESRSHRTCGRWVRMAGAHAAIRVDGLDAVKRTGMSDTNVGQQPGDKSFVINAIGLSHGPERVSGQFRGSVWDRLFSWLRQ